jgi:hypothetical protein
LTPGPPVYDGKREAKIHGIFMICIALTEIFITLHMELIDQFLILFAGLLTLLKVLGARNVLNMGTGLMSARENASIFIAHHVQIN